MKTPTQEQRAGMACARDAVRGPVRDTAEAAAVTLAAMALAALVEHERGEREVVA